MREIDRNPWCPSLRIPQAELLEVDTGAVLDRGDEVLAGCRLAIVAIEIGIGAFAEGFLARHRAHHPDDLGTLVVDGRGVEVADFAIAVRPDGVCERAAVLGELDASQDAHVFDPLDWFTAHVLAE